MPGGDRTGPLGRGSMTGRRAGFCAGYQVPGYENPRYGFGRGFGRGLGRGFGRRYWGRCRSSLSEIPYSDSYNNPMPYPKTVSKEEEKKYLEETKKNLEEEIKSIRKRIEEISKDKV